MTIELEYLDKDELTENQIKQLSKLHLKHGLMWGHFRRKNECEVILATIGRKIIGWGLIFYNKENNENEFHVFVDKEFRRLGIGTEIFDIAVGFYPDGLWTSGWSLEARKFYKSCGELVE